jgi:hypothetical protein
VWRAQLALAPPPTAAWPQLAYASIDRDGDAGFTWLGARAGHIRVLDRRVHSGSEPSSAASLSGQYTDAFRLTAAAAPGGDSALAWLVPQPGGDQLVVRTVSGSGFAGRIQIASAPGASSPQVAVVPSGDGIVAWIQAQSQGPVVQARSVGSESLGPVRTISAAGAQDPVVALGAADAGVIAWLDAGGALLARTVAPSGALGATEAIAPVGAGQPAVAVDGHGDAVLAWEQAGAGVELRTLSAAGALGDVIRAAPTGATAPALAVDPTGAGTLAWVDANGRIVASTVTSAGALGPAESVSEPGATAEAPLVAVGADGTGAVSWSLFTGAVHVAQMAFVAADGTPGAIHSLSAAGVDASSPEVAFSGTGDAAAAWAQSDGTIGGSVLVPATDFGNCQQTSVGLTPITELGTGAYLGAEGGLYPGGADSPPAAHTQAGVAIADSIRPLSQNGKPAARGGHDVLLAVGMSIARREFASFQLAAVGHKNPRLALVNGAINGVTASRWANPEDSAWNVLSERIAHAGYTPAQVVATWLEMVNAPPQGGWPGYAQLLQADTETVLALLHARFPNLRLAYISSRSYAGYATVPDLNPEPYAYQSGFAVKWLVADQLAGESQINWDPGAGPVEAPWLEWGPYLWADGEIPRADGLTWQCADFNPDGTHPTRAGSNKAGDLLLRFFENDPTTMPWFARTP